MNERFKIFLNELFTLLLILFPATLPLSRRASSIILVLLVLIWIHITTLSQLKSLLKSKGFIILCVFFLTSVISLLYSNNRDLFQFEKKLGLIALPLIVGTFAITPLQKKWMFYSFMIGCLIAIVYSLSFAIKSNYQLNQFEFVDYNLFGTEMTLNAVNISHVYFGIYLSFIIAYLLHEIFISHTIRGNKLLGLVTIGVFSIFLFIMGAKMSVIALFSLVFFVGLWLAIRKRQVWGATLIVGIPIILFLLTITFSDYAKGRFIELARPENYFVGDNAWNSIGVRLTIFKCSYEVFKEFPFFGTGIGDVQQDMDKCYQSNNFPSLLGMNAHNQYVQWITSLGIVGFIALFSALMYFLWHSIRSRDWVYFSFYFVVLFCCLTESVFERQNGILFFSFFNSLLFFHGNRLTN